MENLNIPLIGTLLILLLLVLVMITLDVMTDWVKSRRSSKKTKKEETLLANSCDDDNVLHSTPTKNKFPIDFGKIERYENRGFGFVSHTFAKYSHGKVFFHITVLKKTHPELAQKLDNGTLSTPIFFWYEYKTTSMGQEVLALLSPQQLRQKYTDQISAYITIVKEAWLDLEKPLSDSLNKASFDLLSLEEANQLKKRRKTIEAERERRAKAIQAAKKAQEKVKEEEFHQLIAEISALNFTRSGQVSEYIIENKLGSKYKNISGVLQMKLGDNAWKFEGGISPDIYGRLCNELGLENNKSEAIPDKFTPYKDVH